MRVVTDVAIVFSHKQEIIGLGTLAFGDSFKEHYEIAGLWVHPHWRKHTIGLSLLKALSQLCQKNYQSVPWIFALSSASRALVARAEAEGCLIQVALGGGSIEQDFD